MDLSIIILNYNGRRWLEKLLPYIRMYCLGKTRFQVEVVVVDNASTDGSLDYLKTLDFIRLIRSQRNGGFAYGNNLALRDNTARYQMLLNSDTELLQDLSNLDVLVDYMDANPSVGMVTPFVRLDDGKIDPACHRGEPTLWAAFTYFSGLEKVFGKSTLLAKYFGKYHLTHLRTDSIHEIDACTGAAMLVRGTALSRVGLLDERFFMYAEDVDWCKRFREVGYKVVFHPDVIVWHHKYQSGIGNEEETTRSASRYWFYETMLQYYDKHYREKYPAFVRFLLKVFLHSIKRGIV